MPLLKRVFTLMICLISLASSQSWAQMREGEATDVVVQGERSEWQAYVTSNDQATLNLIRFAFTVHGAYDVVDSRAKANVDIDIQPAGAAGVRLKITSADSYTETVTGSSLREATLRAVDRVIAKTTGKPGFFSGKLAYVSDETGSTEVYESDPLFGQIRRITSDNVQAVRPRWSPNGQYIVYTSYKSGFPDVHRLDLVNNRRDVIVDFEGTNMSARYSPDGTRMAVVITGTTNADLWVRESNGSFTKLTRTDALEAAPSWSPDGTRIVYSSGQGARNLLYVTPSRGGSVRVLQTNLSNYCVEPDWNPLDDSKILFTAAVRDGYQIAVFDTHTGQSKWMTKESGDAVEGSWLNDGRHIVYTHRRANNHQIKIVDTVTGKSAILSGRKTTVSQASFVATR